MNWNEIKSKYPKSWELVDNSFGCSRLSDIYGDKYPKLRDLYDFFDGQGMIISLIYMGDKEWSYDICSNDKITHHAPNLPKEPLSRRLAEELIFLQAFKILENRQEISNAILRP